MFLCLSSLTFKLSDIFPSQCTFSNEASMISIQEEHPGPDVTCKNSSHTDMSLCMCVGVVWRWWMGKVKKREKQRWKASMLEIHWMCLYVRVCLYVCAVSSLMKTWHHSKDVVSLKLTASSCTDAAPLEKLNKNYSLCDCTSFIIITFIYHWWVESRVLAGLGARGKYVLANYVRKAKQKMDPGRNSCKYVS